MSNNNKTAIVTGGASGLGLSITKRFISGGIRTIIIGRNKKKLLEAKELMGDLCIPHQFDLTHLADIPTLVQKIKKDTETIDILINNAGIHLKKHLLEVTDEEFQRVILTNLNAVFSISREAGRIMKKQKSGNIIHISSMAAQYGIPQVIAYTAAKSGIEGMTRAMAVELSPYGIRVNCIAPGFITTDMSNGAMNNDPQRKQKALSRTPMGKFGSPEDVADAAYFLVSDAAKYITGVVLPVDGGNSIGF
ncbi:MAG: SDR family oxidoreductase [Chitinophagaceae bacterium]|nr:MAG: SDR family oxidoreductase [Chitinophagaceae bacterium]